MADMPKMTKREFRDLRVEIGYTQQELAQAFQMGVEGKRTIRRWETEGSATKPGYTIPGSAQLALEALAGRSLDHYRALAKPDEE